MTSLDVRNARGQLFVETSCMRGGKTQRLIDIAERLKHSPHRCSAFTPTMNTRDGKTEIVSDQRHRYPAQAIDPQHPEEIVRIIAEQDSRGPYVDVVMLDEANFYTPGLIGAIERLRRDQRRIVLIGGLNWDFRGEPFGPMGALIARADQINVHRPYCQVQTADRRRCQALASHTVRALRRGTFKNLDLEGICFYENSDTEPQEGYCYAPYWHPTVQVEDPKSEEIKYTVTCAAHFKIVRREETFHVEEAIQQAKRGISKEGLQKELKEIPDRDHILQFLLTERRIQEKRDRWQATLYQRDPRSAMPIPYS